MVPYVRLNKAYPAITGTYERLINTWNSFKPETQELILELNKADISRRISFDVQVVEIELQACSILLHSSIDMSLHLLKYYPQTTSKDNYIVSIDTM